MTREPRSPESDLDRTRRAAGRLVLDRLAYALLVVDDRLHPVIMNARALEALGGIGGLRLETNVLRADSPADDRALRTAVAAATAPMASWLSGTTVLKFDGGPAAVPVLVLPAQVNVDPLLGRRGLAVIAFGQGAAASPRDLLRVMYGFTAREGDLACELMAGRNPAEAARALGMTISTARTHLRRLMEKTSTRRQSDLLRVLLGSVP